jgi:2-phospho-L-lactate guanylyltransferase
VLALARDTVRAVLACPLVGEVVAVTDDPAATRALTQLGARAVPDYPRAGLNPALAAAARQLGAARPVAALTADLPALRPAELAAALATVAPDGHRAGFVADTAGTGTTLLAAPVGVAFTPRFGPDSAARHTAAGARRLAGHWPGLRRDVDTPADLAGAERLGLGNDTARLWSLASR